MPSTIIYKTERGLPRDQLVELYAANNWSSAKIPETLQAALKDSHFLVSAWQDEKLVGLGNAISDGHLTVYYPHLLVHLDYQKQGIGFEIVQRLKERYSGFHMHMLTSDGETVEFYEKCGFERAGNTQPMWIYSGNDH